MKRTVWLQETKQMRFDAPHPWGAPVGILRMSQSAPGGLVKKLIQVGQSGG